MQSSLNLYFIEESTINFENANLLYNLIQCLVFSHYICILGGVTGFYAIGQISKKVSKTYIALIFIGISFRIIFSIVIASSRGSFESFYNQDSQKEQIILLIVFSFFDTIIASSCILQLYKSVKEIKGFFFLI